MKIVKNDISRPDPVLHGVFASTIEPVEKPIIGIPAQAPVADFQGKLAAIEQANRDLYYKLIDAIQGDIFHRVDSYLMATHFGTKSKKANNEEQLKARLDFLAKAKLDREYVDLLIKAAKERGGKDRSAKGEEQAVFGAYRAFGELNQAELSAPRASQCRDG